MKETVRTLALFLLAASFFGLAGCRDGGTTKDGPADGPEDGKTVVRSDDSLPKTAPESELVFFDCSFANDVSEELGWGNFELHAEKTAEGAAGSYRFRELNGSFVAPVFRFEDGGEILKECRRILAESGIFAQNGMWEKTEGIPEDLGFSVAARYEDGARLSVSDNAATHFDRETVEKFASLFSRASGAEAFYDTDELISVHYEVYERDVYHFSADVYRTPEGTVAYGIYEKDGDGSSTNDGETDGAILSEIGKIYRENGMDGIQEFPRREGDVYYTLMLAFGKRQERVASNMAISDGQLAALKGVRETILSLLAG